MLRKLVLYSFFSIFFTTSSCANLNQTNYITIANKQNLNDFISHTYRIQFKYPKNLKILNTFDNLNNLEDTTILIKNDSSTTLNELENDLINTSKNLFKSNPIIKEQKIISGKNEIILKILENNDNSIIIGKYPKPYKYFLTTPEASNFVFTMKSKYVADLIKTIDFNMSSDQYLLGVINIIQENSIMKEKINWDTWKKEVINNFQKTKDLSASIKLGLKNLNDNHSSFWSKEYADAIVNGSDKDIGIDFLTYGENKVIFEVFPNSPADKAGIKIGDLILQKTENKDKSVFLKLRRELQNQEFELNIIPDTFDTNIEPSVRVLNNDTGYIELTGSTGLYAYQKYPNIVQEKIKVLLENQTVNNWIIDIRRNTGGATWPMLNAVGGLLGEGDIGGRLDNLGQKHFWHYKDGAVSVDNTILSQLTVTPFKLKNPLPKIAVLTSNTTASAGEGVAIGFKGREKTCFIGESTNGKTTGNNTFILNDGAWLNISDTVNIDRNNHEYFEPIKPDLPLKIDWKYFGDENNDTSIKSALDWFKKN